MTILPLLAISPLLAILPLLTIVPLLEILVCRGKSRAPAAATASRHVMRQDATRQAGSNATALGPGGMGAPRMACRTTGKAQRTQTFLVAHAVITTCMRVLACWSSRDRCRPGMWVLTSMRALAGTGQTALGTGTVMALLTRPTTPYGGSRLSGSWARHDAMCNMQLCWPSGSLRLVAQLWASAIVYLGS